MGDILVFGQPKVTAAVILFQKSLLRMIRRDFGRLMDKRGYGILSKIFSFGTKNKCPELVWLQTAIVLKLRSSLAQKKTAERKIVENSFFLKI